MVPEITFGELTLDKHRRSVIRGALRRIRADGGPGAWPEPVERVDVTRLLDGGRSGATIAQVFLHHGDHRLLHVVKIDSAAALAKEWQAYDRWIRRLRNVLFAPILAATPEVVTNSPGADWGMPAAVVYDHVGQYAGTPRASVLTLEEAVVTTLGDPKAADSTIRMIDTLFLRAGQVLYNRYTVRKAPISLRSLNTTLGPNVTVVVNSADEFGRLQYGRVDSAVAAAAFLPHDEVLTRSLGVEPGSDLVPGDLLTITGLRPAISDGRLIAYGDDIVVEISPESGGDYRVALADLATRDEISVCGLVTATRGMTHRRRLAEAAGDLAGEFGRTFADPFSVLARVLTEPVSNRVSTVAHGDLNPRNVLVVDGNPYLIDYARTTDGRPQQSDFCWLELGLTRDVFADLGFPAMVELQRVLALAAHLLDLGIPPELIERTCLSLVNGPTLDLSTPFRLLWAIRVQAHAHHPDHSGEGWPRSHLEQLLIEAHRTVKWTGEVQSSTKLRATTAMASVASEWLDGLNPFRFWKADARREAFRAVTPLLDYSEDRAVRLCADFVTALESDGRLSAGAETTVALQRARFVRAKCSAAAQNTVLDLSGSHAAYVELRTDPMPLDPVVVLVGGPGSGKTAMAKELVYRLASEVIGFPKPSTTRLPVLIRAANLLRPSTAAPRRPAYCSALREVLSDTGLGPLTEAAFVLGAIHLVIDDIDELAPAARHEVVVALNALRSRYPRIPVVVCRRHGGRDLDGQLVIQLPDLDLDGMRRFLHNTAGQGTHGADIDHLLASLLDDPQWQRAAIRRPAVLRLIADHLRSGGSASTLRPPHDMIVEQLLGADAPALAPLCESLAAALLDSDAPDLAIEPARELLGDKLDHLVGLGVLRRDSTSIRFAEQMHQDTFGARSLAGGHGDVQGRVLIHRWQEACLIFVASPLARASVVTKMVRTVSTVAPVLAARLLYAGRKELPGFADVQASVLRDPEAGPVAWRVAAEALLHLGGQTGRDLLAHAAARPQAATEASRAALTKLAELYDRILSPAERRTTAGVLLTVLHTVLTEAGLAELRDLALAILGRTRLHGLELLMAEFLEPGQPWRITRAAEKALRELGIVLPRSTEDRYRSACLTRMDELEQNPPVAAREARENRAEQIELISALAASQPVEWLLNRRFAFDTSITIAEQLDALPVSTITGHARVLAEPADVDRWLDLIDNGTRLESEASAHRLLRDAPGKADEIVSRTRPTLAEHRLLIAAAAVMQSSPAGLRSAEALFRELLPIVDAERFAGLAALLRAIYTKRRSIGIQLAWTAADVLAERGLPERHQRPWATAMARSRGVFADFDAMLCGDDDSPTLAVSALASYDFTCDAASGPLYKFSATAREKLLSLQPAPSAPQEEIGQWVLAIATAGLAEALTPMRELAKGIGSDVRDRGSARYGLFKQALLADAFTIMGYLARLASDQGGEVEDIYLELKDFDSSGAHESVETGRLIGLAYLGDWVPLLSALPSDPRMKAAAHNAIRLWTPGPFTPAAAPGHRHLAQWITNRLRSPELPNDRRWTLAELKELTQQLAGVVVL